MDDKKSVHRSPNYPSCSLQEAIGRARMFYEKERRAGTTRDIAVKHMGYQSTNGAAMRTLATLKKFGLTEERDGRIFISQLGLDILLYPSTDERHKKALKESALKPKTYADILEQYKDGLPSDETIKAELVREQGFNDKVVDSFLNDFYQTLDFAGLRGEGSSQPVAPVEREMKASDILTSTGGFTFKPKIDYLFSKPLTGVSVFPTATAYAPDSGSRNTYPIPLKKHNQATISFARLPLDKGDLQTLKSWIELMADNLTEPLETQSPTEPLT